MNSPKHRMEEGSPRTCLGSSSTQRSDTHGEMSQREERMEENQAC
jgi:hypothetical protein